MDRDKKNGRVLIVEDDKELAETIQEFFVRQGYVVDCAEDGVKAESLLKRQRYLLILTDVIFFQSGGIDLIRTIRDNDSRTPIVVMTGFGEDVAEAAMEAGANEFLLKPFDLLQMRKKVSKFLDVESMEKRFGVIAVEKGFITAEDLIEVLKIQIGEDIEKGRHRLIGKILLDQGLMTYAQIDEVLSCLDRKPEMRMAASS